MKNFVVQKTLITVNNSNNHTQEYQSLHGSLNVRYTYRRRRTQRNSLIKDEVQEGEEKKHSKPKALIHSNLTLIQKNKRENSTRISLAFSLIFTHNAERLSLITKSSLCVSHGSLRLIFLLCGASKPKEKGSQFSLFFPLSCGASKTKEGGISLYRRIVCFI